MFIVDGEKVGSIIVEPDAPKPEPKAKAAKAPPAPPAPAAGEDEGAQ